MHTAKNQYYKTTTAGKAIMIMLCWLMAMRISAGLT
jgi:hypothetical protein